MPLYNYTCKTHGEFVELRPISERNSLVRCPFCNELATRSITAPNLSIMTTANRTAWQRNEKSMHEPKRVHKHSHACSHGHDHKHDHKHDHENSASSNHTQFKTGSAGSRPWMLGH